MRRSLHVSSSAATALLVVTLLALAACGHDTPAAAPRPAIVVQPGGGEAAYEAFSGDVHAREETPLAFRIGGKIARRLVDAGAHVQAGEALAELDAADVRLQSDANRAQLASAEADLALARADLQRYRELVAKQLVSRSLFDARVAAFQAAEARARQARAQLAGAGNQVAYAVLRAPKAGVIAQRLAEAGQVVAAGQAVFVLAADGAREVAISVPERDVARFAVGRTVAVELWTQPGRRFAGVLRELSPAADGVTRTYAARVAFEAPGLAVDLGQSARVYALAPGAAGLSLPLSALTRAGGGPAVWVVDARGVVHRTPVTIGPYGEDRVPVLSGLARDAWVVAAGAHLLRDGETVAPIDRDNRPVRIGAPAPAGR
jgi:multidrug efflux system membrane fusion protein